MVRPGSPVGAEIHSSGWVKRLSLPAIAQPGRVGSGRAGRGWGACPPGAAGSALGSASAWVSPVVLGGGVCPSAAFNAAPGAVDPDEKLSFSPLRRTSL